MELMTSACKSHGHPEIVVEIGDAGVDEGKWFVKHLETSVAEGERYAAGETVQLGWMHVRLESAAPGYLSLSEPDLRSMPIRWVPGVSRALKHLRLQVDVVRDAGLIDEIEMPSILERALVCTRYREGHEWVLARAEPTPGDCGWFLGCTSPDHDHNDPATLQPISIYEAVLYVPQAVDYLALPADSQVIFGRGIATAAQRSGVDLVIR